MLTRSSFLAMAAALHAEIGPLPAVAQVSTDASQLPRTLRRALVLSGGGALGAYEAGALRTLVAKAGVREGEPLPQYGLVTGASIGALNGFLVATAQWEMLDRIWQSISSQNVIRLKPRFAKIAQSNAGVGSRVAQALSLAFGSTSNVQGVLDGDHLQQWLLQYVDLKRPVVTSFFWSVTNLSEQKVEYFYLLPDTLSKTSRDLALRSIQLSLGPNVAVREADRSILVELLRASAAVPLAFDPVVLPDVQGRPTQYVDGGVTANTPVNVARAVSSAVDAILLGPVFQRTNYQSMIEITSGSFGTMQRSIMEYAVRAAYLETFVWRAIKQVPDSFLQQISARHEIDLDQLKLFSGYLADTSFYVLRPKTELPANLFGFDDEKSINATYRVGELDGQVGFSEFTYKFT